MVLEQPLERWREFPHQLRITVGDLGLFQLGSGGVDLGAWLAIEGGQVKADSAESRALATLTRHFFIPLAEAAGASRTAPAELHGAPELLPGLQHDGLACLLAPHVPQELREEVDDVGRAQ